MENFYFLFSKECIYEDLGAWSTGMTFGFLILILISIFFNAVFYLFLGKGKSASFSSIGKWFLFMLINSILIFAVSFSVIAAKVFEVPIGGDTPTCIWIFSLLNGTIYSIVIYFILSLVFNNFSTHSKFIPFNIFKK